MEIFSLIREYKHDWPNNVKTFMHFYVILNSNKVDFESNYLLIFLIDSNFIKLSLSSSTIFRVKL